ncbi:bZIP transcription factor tga10, variant 2 [Dionaea muscipula]
MEKSAQHQHQEEKEEDEIKIAHPDHHQHHHQAVFMGSINRATASTSMSSHQTHLFGFQQIHHHHQLGEQQHDHQHQHQQHQQQQQQYGEEHRISFGMMPSSSSTSLLPAAAPPTSYIVGKEVSNGAYDLGELDQALFLYLDGQAAAATAPPPPTTTAGADTSSSSHHHHHQQQQQQEEDQNQSNLSMRPPILNIFPSQPMHVEPTTKGNNNAMAAAGGSRRPSEMVAGAAAASSSMGLPTNPKNEQAAGTSATRNNAPAEPSKAVKRDGNRKGPTSSSEQEGPKTPDPKTLRRLAQNREAARKSRLRKKAYVQQLESSRIKLTQLEHELQRARAQGMLFGGGLLGGDQGLSMGVTNISSDAAVFDMEYARWLEEQHRLTCELRAAVQEHMNEAELKLYVDNCLAHYDVLMNLKNMVAKSDVFHIFSGMWKTPAERCFMWMGGFRPSDLIKIIVHQVEPLTEQQLLGICQLQQSMQEAEEALSQGHEALNQSLSDTITSDSLSCPAPNMANYMGQMALAMNKLSTLENFVRQVRTHDP